MVGNPNPPTLRTRFANSRLLVDKHERLVLLLATKIYSALPLQEEIN
jgi:hypothetical protein